MYFMTLCGLLSNLGRAVEVAVVIRAVSCSYFRGVRRFILCMIVKRSQCIQHKFLSQSSVLTNKGDPERLDLTEYLEFVRFARDIIRRYSTSRTLTLL